jgi:ABC-type lipoprotein export system ATPase subunit/YHS domain-containing protein
MEKKKKYDPVCGMDVSVFNDALKSSYKKNDFLFCSQWCKSRFENNPKKFSGEPLISLKDVWKVFQMGDTDTKVLREMNLNIWEGDFVALVGASGSGKSTSLNMMGLLDRPTSGSVFLKGKNMSFLQDDERAVFRTHTFGFVFQQYNLIPWLTAYENVTLPLIFSNKKTDIKRIEDRFKEIGINTRMEHRPFELSGGEQQRVALLRALANDPDIILGDEPTGNLDSKTGEKILDILIDLNKRKGKTLVIVTHDAGIAERADQVIALKDGNVIRNHQEHKKIYTE